MKSGSLNNFSSETNDLVNPELTPPKAKVHTIISTPTVVKTPVLLGHETEHYQVNVEHKGKSRTHQVTMTKPILGEVHQVRNIDVHHDKYVNLETGVPIDDAPAEKKFFGIDPNEVEQDELDE